MPTFTTPIEDSPASIGGYRDPLWRYYGNHKQGKTVWKFKSDQAFTDIERNTNIVTVSFAAPHGFSVGDTVTIVVPTNSSYNGTFVITEVPSAFLFKYPQTGPNNFTSGGFVSFWKQSSYPYQGGFVNRNFNDDEFTIDTDTSFDSLANAREIYMGGGLHEVDITKANELLAAGFTFEWWQLTNWTNSWDAKDSIVDNGRIRYISDMRGRKPLVKMPGPLPLLGANVAQFGNLPGPLYLSASPRFNNRPALYTDPFPVTGALAPLFAGLSPNFSDSAGTNEPVTWFNSPTGYPQPYWVAVLARLTGTNESAIWDAQNGTDGTGPTIGPDIFGGVDDKWEVSLFGPDGGANKIEVNHVSSSNETVLVFCYVNGGSSFLEVTWKDGAGVPTTLRQSGSLGAHKYKELFLGWLHDTYWSTAGIKLGTPTEPELDFVRNWALPFIPAAAVLPPGV